jgi:uncharacterized circularly permuted ATP-grasp superfamily protein/uncharacterized alpha-E superfamily protein
MKAPDGRIRPAWQKLAETLGGAPAPELARREENLRRLIQENGITYNVYSEPGSTARLWGMDLLPMILTWEEWGGLDAALRQRVHLFNLILQDLYGPQTLLEQRVLPPELVLGNPLFLRPCHGFTPPGGIFINLYGADLGRAPNGQWWVLADRVDAPSGIGYALENRYLTTRVAPDWLRQHPVARLEGFFETMRLSLENLVERRAENPRLVLLTPGPYNETYFEHSFLARNQGFPLVEGGDLTVRAGKVYLKTLAGLQPVDLIVRRVDSDFCDPLELRADSLLGVPGLLQVARTGQITLANSLGAGLLESAGLSPFFPALCQHFLGEEMKMPSVATWWCGQPRELNYVLEHIDELILQPAFPEPSRSYASGARLSSSEREQWRARLRAEPARWCARERVALATTPMLEEGRLAARLFHLRSFLVANGDEYLAMPGGLTRIPAEPDDLSVSMQRGGRGKDTWVLHTPEVSPPVEIGAAPSGGIKLRRQSGDLPSRTADNLYWLGRYLERAEGQARVLRLLASSLTEDGPATEPGAVLPFFHTLLVGEPARLLTDDKAKIDLGAAEACLRTLIWDSARTHSLVSNVSRLETAAARVKERLANDAWRLLHRLQRLRRTPESLPVLSGRAHGDLVEAIVLLAAISGLLMENMTRGYGWHFLDLGRRIERGIQVAVLLQHAFGSGVAPTPALLQNLLACCDSQLTYRRRYLTHLHPAPVLDLLVCDDSNPRSLAFQLRVVREHVEALPRAGGEAMPGAPERLALGLFSQARLVDVRQIAEEGAAGTSPTLADFLITAARDLSGLSEALGQVYFAHGQTETS